MNHSYLMAGGSVNRNWPEAHGSAVPLQNHGQGGGTGRRSHVIAAVLPSAVAHSKSGIATPAGLNGGNGNGDCAAVSRAAVTSAHPCGVQIPAPVLSNPFISRRVLFGFTVRSGLLGIVSNVDARRRHEKEAVREYDRAKYLQSPDASPFQNQTLARCLGQRVFNPGQVATVPGKITLHETAGIADKCRPVVVNHPPVDSICGIAGRGSSPAALGLQASLSGGEPIIPCALTNPARFSKSPFAKGVASPCARPGVVFAPGLLNRID